MNFLHYTYSGGRRWRSWLKHCATTSQKVAFSIPDGVTGIFYWHNPSGRTMTLGLTQFVTEMSTRNITWGVKVAGAWGWQPYHIHVPIVLKSGSRNLLEHSGPVQTCNGTAFKHEHWHYEIWGCHKQRSCRLRIFWDTLPRGLVNADVAGELSVRLAGSM